MVRTIAKDHDEKRRQILRNAGLTEEALQTPPAWPVGEAAHAAVLAAGATAPSINATPIAATKRRILIAASLLDRSPRDQVRGIREVWLTTVLDRDSPKRP